MALDNLSLSIIVRQLGEALKGAILSKPFPLSAVDYALPFTTFRGEENSKGTVIFSLNPANPFVCYSKDRYAKVDDNSPFFNSLKKLTGGRVLSIEKEEGERVVTLHVKADVQDITETNTGYDLILELFPNHPNVYLIAYPYGRIVSLYRERVNLEKGILLTRNAPYSYPPVRKTLTREARCLEDCKPFLSNACYRAFEEYVSNGKPFDDALEELLSSERLFLIGKNIFPHHFGIEGVKEISAQEIYASLVQDQKEAARLSKVKELYVLMEKALKSAKKKLANLQEDLENARKGTRYLEYGQLIYLYQADLPKGCKCLERDGKTIPLDPLLDAAHNANRYFKRYTKSKAACTILGELIEKTKLEIEYLEKKRLEVLDGTPRDIMELKSELLSEGYIKERQGRKSAIPKASRKRRYEPHYLRLEQGTIAFGMNGLQNETLTFDVAKKEDVFVHVKDYPGSHVLILQGKDCPEIVRLACELALFLSHLSAGEVMLADRRNVKKNPERVGLVHVLKYETLNFKEIRPSSRRLFEKALKM